LGFDLAPDGKTLVLTDRRGIHLLDPRSGKERRRFPVPMNTLTMFHYTEDGRSLLAGDGTRRTIFVNPVNGKELRRVEKLYPRRKDASEIARSLIREGITIAHTLSADGLIEVDVQEVSHDYLNRRDDEYEYRKDLMGPERTFARLWDMNTGKSLGHIELRPGFRYEACLSKDKKTLATWGERKSWGERKRRRGPPWDRVLQCWDVVSAKELHRRRIRSKEFLRQGAISPDGKVLALGGGRAIILWSVPAGRELRRLALRPGSECQHLMYSPNGKLLVAATGEGGASLWEAATGKHLGTAPKSPRPIWSFAFPAGGKVWAWGMARQAFCLREVPSGKRLTPLEGHRDAISAVCFSPDGRKVLSADAEGKVCRWDRCGRLLGCTVLEFNEKEGNWDFTSQLRFSPDGKSAMTAEDFQKHCFRLWETAGGKAVRDFPTRRAQRPLPPAFAACGRRLALGWDVGTIDLWDLESGRMLKQWKTGNSGLRALALSPASTRLATAHRKSEPNKDDLVLVRNTATGKTLCRFEWPEHRSVAYLTFSPDGRLLAVGDRDGAICLFKAATGRKWAWLRGPFEYGKGGHLNSSLVFSPDGRRLAVAWQPALEEPSRVQVWEVAGGGRRHDFSGQRATLLALAFSPDGRTLAGGGRDTTVVLWDLAGSPPARAKGRLTAKERERLWDDLAVLDAPKAYRAIVRLTTDPESAVTLLRHKLRPLVSDLNDRGQRFGRLIRELDTDTFRARQKAARELEQLGSMARPALEKTLRSHPSLEVHRRIQKLLCKLDQLGPDLALLRPLRAVEALERIGTLEAQKVLHALGKGAAEGRLPQEAKASLTRLSKWPAARP
jgi:WD40 repeat protein